MAATRTLIPHPPRPHPARRRRPHPRRRNQTPRQPQPIRRHVHIYRLQMTRRDNIGLMPDPNRPIRPNPPVERRPGRQMRPLRSPRITLQMPQTPPILNHHHIPKPEMRPPRQHPQPRISPQLRQHPRHRPQHRPPPPNLPKAVDPHPDQENDDLPLNLRTNPPPNNPRHANPHPNQQNLPPSRVNEPFAKSTKPTLHPHHPNRFAQKRPSPYARNTLLLHNEGRPLQ